MNLKPQDILFLLKLVAIGRKPWSFNNLATELAMSPSEVHGAAKRALAAGLAVKRDDVIQPERRHLAEFLLHGIQYVFLPERGGLSQGMATGRAVEPLASGLEAGDALPPVWPDPQGQVRGEAFSPLYRSAPQAARRDADLYRLLALVDAIRGGQPAERALAKQALKKRLSAAVAKRQRPGSDKDALLIADSLVVSRAALQALVRRFHIRRLSLFGSAARGELTPDSDIDLLVEFEDDQSPSLGGMVDIQSGFSDLFGGRQVDVATPAILNNPYRQRAIEKDLEELYAA